MSSLVRPARADRTTTVSLPSSRAAFMRSATLRILSTSPTEVPPYFWTILGIVSGFLPLGSVLQVPYAQVQRGLAHAPELRQRPQGSAHRALVALVGGEDERRGARPLRRVLDDARDANAVASHDGRDAREHARPVRHGQPDVVAPVYARRRRHPGPAERRGLLLPHEVGSLAVEQQGHRVGDVAYYRARRGVLAGAAPYVKGRADDVPGDRDSVEDPAHPCQH